MKRKIFATLLALCMLVTCAFVLSACDKGDGTSVSKSDWNSALNLTNKSEISSTTLKGDMRIEMKYDGTNYSQCVKSLDSEEPINETRWIKDGNKYVVYNLERNGSWSNYDETVQFFEESISMVKQAFWINYSNTFKFEDFTYNEQTKQFEASDILQ